MTFFISAIFFLLISKSFVNKDIPTSNGVDLSLQDIILNFFNILSTYNF